MDDEEYKKLPLDERCTHKLWKARVNGYEEVTKLFRQIDDEKSPEFSKYLGLVKKFVVDSNAMGQEKGLEATLAFVENYAHAGKTVGEVMSGIVTKCIAAPKTRTRELALQVTLMYIEIEKYDTVEEELVKGMDLKNPKIVAACINACTVALREFGSKVINLKPLIKKITVLFSDRDKAVRDEARLLVIEMFKWIGAGLRQHLSGLQAVQISELETEFAKIEGQKAVPTRYLRSQQKKQAKMVAENAEVEDDEDAEDEEEAPHVDPYDLADPVDILSKLPKDFYEKLEAKKWQERKEVLENLENLTKTPKLENGDYGDLIRALKKVIQKDSNVLVVCLAARCCAHLALGLKKRFQQYAGACIPAYLEKFKEKKQNVVTALREAIDAAYATTTMESILDDVLEALNNKNPSVKSETASFLSRAFTKTLPTSLNKKLLKAITGALIKNVNEPDPTVRDCSSEALGTLMKLVGEKAVAPFLVELEKDNLKMTKIRECCEKAVITVKVPTVKKERPTTAPVTNKSSGDGSTAAKSGAKRPTSSAPPKPKAKITSGTATVVKSKGNKVGKSVAKPKEKELSDDEAMELVADLINTDLLAGLSDTNWKTRLGTVEDLTSQLQKLDSSTIPTQAFVRVVNRKPGLKDTNFQVLKARLDVVKFLAENCVFTTTCADCVLNDVVDKLGDAKNGTTAAELLTAIAEATSLSYVAPTVLEVASAHKSPKVTQEALLWMSNAIKEFGFTNMNSKPLIESSKKALASNSPAVRQAAITFLGTLYLYLGHNLNVYFENEKSSLRDLINAEFDKYENDKPPAPTRGLSTAASSDSLDQLDEDSSSAEPPVPVQDQLPRVDISAQITEPLINELSDKNWKVRNEALTRVATVITEARSIKPNIGDLPQALALRLVDSNSKIAQAALSVCENLANSMGAPCKQHVRVLFPGLLQGLGDSKTWIRSASLSAINTFGEQCSYKEFFEGEMIGDALKTGSPMLRAELWAWLAEKLPKIKSVPKEELLVCIPHLYANLEDRNADVRKNAQDAVLGIMIHLGYDSMAKQVEKLKPSSKTAVMAALDKARPNLPVKALPKKSLAPEREDKAVRGTKAVANSKNAVRKPSPALKAPSANRKKDDDVDTSPLLVINNMKHQRTIDESKLKVLKWNFTTPREEFVELLKEQMISANVNRTLISNMFHSDFRCHIKAIESLMDDLQDNNTALICNLDLVLKWLTLRFFDTNPSVLLKGLEYLHSVFNMLIDNKYTMLENEASSFIPYLVLKIGDPKDSVRNGVRSLFKQIGYVYSISRLFSYIMDGIKSKNARQRAECLEVMGSIIEDYGVTVCLPSPASCLKEVAKQISDRDNAVRNAALNCVVQAYYLVGDKVFKMVGQISDKDMSLLEERIKRASKRPLPVKIAKIEPTLVSPQREITPSPVKEDPNPPEEEEDEEYVEEDNIPQVQVVRNTGTYRLSAFRSPMVQTERAPDVFHLDRDVMDRLDSISANLPKVDLNEFNMDFLNEKVTMPTRADVKAKIMPLSPPKPIIPTDPLNRNIDKPRLMCTVAEDVMFEQTIKQIASSDFLIVLKACNQIQDILAGSQSNLMVNYEDQFMMAVATQLQNLDPHNLDIIQNGCKVYKGLLTIIDAFYTNKSLGKNISTDVIKDLLYRLILLLINNTFEKCTDASAYVRVINLQCVKIIERSDHTNIICAVTRLLHDAIKTNAPSRLVDLVTKCLWRVIKMIPSWADEIHYDFVLLDVHLFLKDFPSTWWKARPSDTPLRTIKTILHSCVKIKGGTITNHLGKIPNTSESELEVYIARLLKSMKLEEVKQITATPNMTSPLTRQTQMQLTEIFQKIGDKAQTKEGLNLLYDFLQTHPEGEIEPFLKKSSDFFKDYIKKGLANIEETRKKSALKEKTEEKADPISKPVPSTNDLLVRANNVQGVQHYRELLKAQKQAWADLMGRNVDAN